MPIGANAGTIVRGQRKVTDVAAARQVLQVEKEMINVSADVAPLYAMLKKLGNVKKVNNPVFYWYETDWLPKYITVGSAGFNGAETNLTSAANEITAGDGSRVNVGTVLKNQRTGEYMLVTVVTSANDITVSRGQFGGPAGAAALVGDQILIESFADTEGNTSPSGISSEPAAPKSNVCQTIRQAVDMSGRELELETYGGDDWTRALKDSREAMLHHQEAMMLTSGVRQTTSPNKAAGAEFFVTTNVTNVGGLLTEPVLVDNFITPWFRQNNSKKNMAVFAGEKFCRALDVFGRDLIRYDTSDTGIGIKVMKYRSNFGEIEIIRHGALTPSGFTSTSATNLGLQGYAYGLNLDLCKSVQLGSRGMKLRTGVSGTGIAAPDVDGKKVEWLADVSFQLQSETQHAILKGITG